MVSCFGEPPLFKLTEPPVAAGVNLRSVNNCERILADSLSFVSSNNSSISSSVLAPRSFKTKFLLAALGPNLDNTVPTPEESSSDKLLNTCDAGLLIPNPILISED